MAVTVSQQPEDYTPGFNPQLFVALSTQVASANFVYTVVVTDLLTSDSIQYQVAKDPNDDRCYFDAMPFVENYVQHHIPINEYGWQQCPNAVRKIRVNIGETYGSTGSEILYPGSNIDYIVWNGVINYLDFPDYDPADYVYSTSNSHFVFLTENFDDVTFEDRSNFLYALTSEAGDIEELRVETYDVNGTVVTQSVIPNPFVSLTDYDDKYICIDIGHKGLSNIDAGDVTGDYPIITDDVVSYSLSIAWLTGAPPAYNVASGRNYTVGCEVRYDVYTVHFLGNKGGFETINFSKRSDTESRKQESTYKVTPYTKSGGAMTYSRSSTTEKVLSSGRSTRLKLNTDWLTQDQVDLYEQILDSPRLYLDQGPDIEYARIKLITDSYKINKRYNERLFQITMDFEYTHTNYRQR